MADILSIDGRTRPSVLREEIVDCLSRWLESAKRGELTSLAMAAVHSDGDTMICVPPTDEFSKILGAVTMLQHDMLNNVEEY